jgi:hypothetical protein
MAIATNVKDDSGLFYFFDALGWGLICAVGVIVLLIVWAISSLSH